MNNSNNRNRILEEEIYPRIFENAPFIFSELELKPYRGGYRSHLGLFGREPRTKRKEKVVITSKMPFSILEQGGETLSYWSYVKRKFNLSTNKEVLEKLSNLANYNLPKIEDKEALKRIEKAQQKSDILESLNSFFTKNLIEESEAQQTREYLKERGSIYLEKSLEFELGFIGSRNKLSNFIHSLTPTDKALRSEIETLFTNISISSSNCLSPPLI